MKELRVRRFLKWICELPTSEEAGFLIHRPDSIPAHPKPQAPSWAFPSEAFGKAGYGGHDLQRRIFGLSHPYRGMIEEADMLNSSIHPMTKVVSFLESKS
jgi:hypothetical protein